MHHRRTLRRFCYLPYGFDTMLRLIRSCLAKGAGLAAALALLCGITAVVPQTADAFSFFQNEATVNASDLPREAQATLALIKAGGPFPYAKDGTVFGNYERILPRQKRGYYTEYTVKTPGLRNRGPRRIIAGKGTTGDPATSGEYWYTADHYQSFRRIKER